MWSSRPPGMPLPLAEVSEITMSPSSKWSSLSPREVAPAGSSLTLTPAPSGRFPEPRRVRRERTNLSRSHATTCSRTRGPRLRMPPGGVRGNVRSLVQAVVLPCVHGVGLGPVRLRRGLVERAVAAGLVEGAVARLGDGVAAVEVAAVRVVTRALGRSAVAVIVAGDLRAVGPRPVDVAVRHAGGLVGAAHLWLPRRGASRRAATVRHVPAPPTRQPDTPAHRPQTRREAGPRAGAGLTAFGI